MLTTANHLRHFKSPKPLFYQVSRLSNVPKSFGNVEPGPTAQLGQFHLPEIVNEPTKNFAPGSPERAALRQAIDELRSNLPVAIPCVVDGMKLLTNLKGRQVIPYEHSTVLAEYHQADKDTVDAAIRGALHAKKSWEAMPFYDRAAIFLKAADLISTKYRYKLMAATMLGQSKNIWQAEIDAATELPDFFRFNVKYADEIYKVQPPRNSEGIWNRLEWRALEGFVAAISPFNFTAIGGNLVGAPALMGNVCLWKPSDTAVLAGYVIMELLEEAGLPPGVIQFIPGPAPTLVPLMLKHKEFAGLHFTGSSSVFRKLYQDISMNLEHYRGFPRIVGETGGKNMHFVHASADPVAVANHTIRAAFEYQGQKCSACSRLYVPDNLWPKVKEEMVKGIKAIKMGSPEDFTNFMTTVIHKQSFDKCKSYIDYAKSASDAEIVVGGGCDDSKGYFVEPTVILTTNPQFKSLREEIFGPVLTVFVYPADQFDHYLHVADETSEYGLTCALFASDRKAIIHGTNVLRNAAGNFYVNDKCTGAVVGQQPFGGARQSGTNDKAGAGLNLYRWVSARTVKESFRTVDNYLYPSNMP